MGDEVDKDHYDEEDYLIFKGKLDEETNFVRQLFADRNFDQDSRKLGYELELCLLDDNGAPAPCNRQVLEQAANPLFTYELAKFNLEINGNAFDVCADVFGKIDADLNILYSELAQAAEDCDVQAGLFGVLPSLQQCHLDERYMSELYRYHILDQRLIEMRQRPVHLELHGDDHLLLEENGVMLEALSTSLQTHYQIPFDEAVDSYHAALWTSMTVLAVGANSPLVMGKQCWQESRIAIFKQAVDTRNPREIEDAIVPRVHFGKGYINSWLDLFEDNNSYYSPILPETRDCDIGMLHHFNLHNGTIWRWVRPILGIVNGQYHLRLELRVTPSGPTLVDTLANMVFSIGLLEGLKQAPKFLTSVPFEVLEASFYRVAREGLEAEVKWCNGKTDRMQNLVLSEALTTAAKGLDQLGIENCQQWLDIIQARVSTGCTGSDWILKYWQKKQDISGLVKTYLHHARKNAPVHKWPQP